MYKFMYLKTLCIFGLIFSSSGCANLIISGICQVQEKPEDIPEKYYEAQLTYKVNGIVETQSTQYACKPDYLVCGGGEWRHQYADLSHYKGFTIQVEENKIIDISRPLCSTSSTLGSDFDNLGPDKTGNIQARVNVNNDLYILYVSELFQKSADVFTGLKIVSYKAREKK